MAWQEITTAEIAPRQPLDSELFNKIRNNLYIGLGSLGLPKIIPNGSFESATGVVPTMWTVTSYATATGGSASISTVSAHGAYSLKLTRSAVNAKIGVFSDDYIAVASTQISLHEIIWSTGATSSAIKGGLAIQCFKRDYTTATPEIVHDNTWQYSSNMTTRTVAFGMSSLTRFIKIGCYGNSDSTVLGSLHFDALYIVNT